MKKPKAVVAVQTNNKTEEIMYNPRIANAKKKAIVKAILDNKNDIKNVKDLEDKLKGIVGKNTVSFKEVVRILAIGTMSIKDIMSAGSELGLNDKVIEYMEAKLKKHRPVLKRLFILALELKCDKGVQLTDADFIYYTGLMDQLRNPVKNSAKMEIGEDFFPSALLLAKERAKMGVVNYSALASNIKNREEAKSIIALFNPMEGGVGSSLKREKYITDVWKKLRLSGKPKLGSKSMDEYFTVMLDGHQEIVSIAEARLLGLANLADNKIYSKVIYQPLLSYATIESMQMLLRRPCLEDRLAGTDIPRSYRDWIEQKAGINLAKSPIQGLFPTINKDNEILSIDRVAPGGHGQWGVKEFIDAINDRLPVDDRNLISTIYNGDGINNEPDEIMIGWMHKNRVPIALITTTKTGLDMKGGQIGKTSNKNKFYLDILEVAQAKTNDQLKLFEQMGLTKGEAGAQYFNTNTVIINWGVVAPFLKDLVEIIGENEFNTVICPVLIQNDKIQNGKKYTQLEGGIGSVMLNLNRYLSLTEDETIIALMKKHDIEQMVKIINVEAEHRTSFFTPVKSAFDFWFQFFSGWFCIDTKNWRISAVKPEEQLPMVSFDDDYYKDISNLLDAFAGVSVEGLKKLSAKGKVNFAGVKMLAGNISVDSMMDGIAKLRKLLPKKFVSNGLEDAVVIVDRAEKTMVIVNKEQQQILEDTRKFGQQYINRLVELTKEKLAGIEVDAKELVAIETFILFGNPDLDSLINFTKIYKGLIEKGKYPKIVLTGGTGRGTLILIEKVIEKYCDMTKEENEFLLAEGRKESEIMRFVLRKEGVDPDLDKNIDIDIEIGSTNTYENIVNSAKKIRGSNVALVTSPVLLLRIGATFRKVLANKNINIKTLITYDINLNQYQLDRQIEIIGYILGYPEDYKGIYNNINIYSEFRGTQQEYNANVDTVELSNEDWQLLDNAGKSFKQLLNFLKNRLVYEKASGRLILGGLKSHLLNSKEQK